MQAATDFTSLDLSRELVSLTIPGLGPFALRWYALAYLAGVLAAWWYVMRLLRAPAAPMTGRDADELVTWATLGIILGGRTAYMLFYDYPAFAANPLTFLEIWKGGMAFHGGMLGVGIAIILYCRRAGLVWLRVTDYVACAAPIGLFFGRLANFVNGELWGRPTGASWGVIFPDAGPLPRHPSQLYEAALEGLALFTILSLLFWGTRTARLKPGLLTGAFLFLYGVFRFIIEYFREPDAQLGLLPWGLSMGQSLCVPMLAGGAWLIATAARRRVPVVPTAGLEAQQ